MKKDIMKQAYMQYVSNVKKARKEHIDIPVDQIIKKTGKKKQ